jgi:putative transposase
MVALARFFDWRGALAIVKPETVPQMASECLQDVLALEVAQARTSSAAQNLRELVCRMARENPTWGEERIANELSLKLGIRVSPRTVGKYLKLGNLRGNSGQRWTTFVRNHAQAIVACDFFVSVTSSFRVLYVFVAMEIGSRRILHRDVTGHPLPSGRSNISARF